MNERNESTKKTKDWELKIPVPWGMLSNIWRSGVKMLLIVAVSFVLLFFCALLGAR